MGSGCYSQLVLALARQAWRELKGDDATWSAHHGTIIGQRFDERQWGADPKVVFFAGVQRI
jgi:hypothetical protein